MSALSGDLLVIFSVLTTSVFLWRFIRDKNLAEITFKKLAPGLKVLLAIVIPVAAVMMLSQTIGLQLAGAAPYFAGAVALPFLLSQINVPPFLRALVLLGASVAFTCLVPADNYQIPLAAVVAGLACWKSAENLLMERESTLEDFLPSYLWLVAIYWTKTVDPASWLAHHQNLVIGSFIVAILLRWLQGPFLKQDKLYVKRLCFAVFGGLVLLIITTKLIVVMDFGKMCLLAGAGYLLTYMLQAMDKASENDSIALKSFKQLLFIGIFTLLSTRLFFTPGLIVLAISTMIATTSGAAMIAGLYWGSYVFLQTFIYKFNSNMTGINVMHTYTSAALYAGLLIAITACLLIRERVDSRAKTLLFISAALIAPPAANFFLHAEPAASLLLAVLIGSVLVALFSRPLAGLDFKGYENIMLVPGLMISVGLLTGELINKGNYIDSQQRLTALIGLAVLSSVVLAVASFWSRQNGKGPDPVAIEEARVREEEKKKVDILPHAEAKEAEEESKAKVEEQSAEA